MTESGRMCQTHLWAICDAIKEGSVVVEWGAGLSTKFLLENSRVAELYAIEHNPFWRGRVLELCGDDTRMNMVFFRVHESDDLEESTRGFIDYSLIDGVPLDRADVIIVDGMARATCCATAALRAKVGALLFLHDADSNLYRWSVAHMDAHPDWLRSEEIHTLPEDSTVCTMTVWKRVA